MKFEDSGCTATKRNVHLGPGIEIQVMQDPLLKGLLYQWPYPDPCQQIHLFIYLCVLHHCPPTHPWVAVRLHALAVT